MRRIGRRDSVSPFLARQGIPHRACRLEAGDHAFLRCGNRIPGVPRRCGVLVSIDIDQGVLADDPVSPDRRALLVVSFDRFLPELFRPPSPSLKTVNVVDPVALLSVM